MDKKIECKIVQDLLLGYVDDVLNEESKNIVEKHLTECESCKERLKEIKTDIEENEVLQEKEIDYLRKIKKKNWIKLMIAIIGIIVFIGLAIYIKKFFIINDLLNKEKISLESQNFYKETIQRESRYRAVLIKEYYKNGKYKSVTEIYTDEGKKGGHIEYATVNSDERIIDINHEKKTVMIEKGEATQRKNSEKFLKSLPGSERYGLAFKLKTAFFHSIDTSYKSLGREYYVMNPAFDKDSDCEKWVDKDTGLILKLNSSANGTAVTYFPNSKIVREESELVYEYRYEFGTVTDEDVEIPDYTDYEVTCFYNENNN